MAGLGEQRGKMQRWMQIQMIDIWGWVKCHIWRQKWHIPHSLSHLYSLLLALSSLLTYVMCLRKDVLKSAVSVISLPWQLSLSFRLPDNDSYYFKHAQWAKPKLEWFKSHHTPPAQFQLKPTSYCLKFYVQHLRCWLDHRFLSHDSNRKAVCQV